MPVDRSISGIRISGPTERRRRTTRFPTQVSTTMNHRRPSPRPDGGHPADITRERHRHRAGMEPPDPPTTAWQPAVAHRPDRRTVHVGRVGAHSPASDGLAGTGMMANEPALGRSRRPVRALVVGLLLATTIGAGVGVAALAMGATEAPETGVPGATVPATAAARVTGSAGIAGEPIVSGPAGTAAATEPANSTTDPAGSAPDTASNEPSPAVAVPGPFLPTQPGSVDGPAMVSTLAPGDPGFGWPSSAFGVAP
jgi:hypothetical protein